MSDTQTQVEGAIFTPVPGEAFRVSECCLAPVENIVTKTDDSEEHYSSHFVCTNCGNECLCETSQRVVALKRELAALRATQRISEDAAVAIETTIANRTPADGESS